MQQRQHTLFTFLTAFFCVVVIVSDLVAAKMFNVGFLNQMALPVGLLTYPLAFSLSDLVTELYGPSRARLMIYLGFLLSFVAFGIVQMAVQLTPHPVWLTPDNPWGYSDVRHYQSAYESVFSMSGISLSASLTAYTVGQLLDVTIYAWIRSKTGTPHLWLRNVVSTLVSQIFDTAIVSSIVLFWGFHLDWPTILQIGLFSYGYKAFFAIANVPLFYAAVGLCTRYLNPHVQATP